jgi:sugar phosphate isomerase/epimerase
MAPKDPLGIQLYSFRKFPPLEQQLETVRRCGFTNVETFGALHEDVAGLAAALQRHGLTAKSGHFALALVESELARVVDIAGALGMPFVVAPHIVAELRPSDSAGWAALGERLAETAARLRAQGLRFAWHNHDFEFRPLADGSYPIEHLLAEGVLWEADIAWVIKGGADPKPWLERYRGRTPLVHVKDIAAQGEKADEDGWADVGAGTMAWPQLWDLAVAAGAEIMIAEHDNPSDPERFARVSAAAMQTYAARGAA